MPFIEVQGVRLYYQVHGRALSSARPPLLLIAGLGFATWCWFRQLPTLTQHFQVIVFDNRGTGRSEKPSQRYTVATLADDAAGLLAALSIPRAHVLGTSLGGFIAQELALRHPERVANLVLCCTSYGGLRSIPMRLSALTPTLGWGALTPSQTVRRGLEIATTPDYRAAHPREFAKMVTWRQRDAPASRDYLQQAMAGMRFDGAQRVHAIAAPTLVIHGADDKVVPLANADLLAKTIPNAVLQIVNNAGHLVFIEQADEVNRVIMEFLGPAPLPVVMPLLRGIAAGATAATRLPTHAWQWLRARLASRSRD